MFTTDPQLASGKYVVLKDPIIAMNKAVAIDHQQPATVAAAFLKANNLS